MDLQFLTAEQLELALKLSDILSMQDLTVAAAVLASFDWNIEKTINQMQLGPVQQNFIRQPSTEEPYISAKSQQHQAQPIDPNPYAGDDEQQYAYDEDDEYTQNFISDKRKMFEQEYVSLLPLQKTLSEPNKELNILQYHKLLANDTRAHRQDYFVALMNKSQSFCKNILEAKSDKRSKFEDSKKKVENNRLFINHLYTNYHPKINFTFGTFFLNLTRAYLQDKYLLVYIHNIAPESQSKFKKLIEMIFQQREIANFVNKHCITYGMFDNSDDYQTIQKYVPMKDLPAFALFRLNKNKRSQEFISLYKVYSQGQIFLEWLAKSSNIKLKKRQNLNAPFQKEKELKEEIKQEEIKKEKEAQNVKNKIKKESQIYHHHQIVNQQNQLYAYLQKAEMKKRQISLDRKQQLKLDEQNLQLRKKEALKNIEPQQSQNTIQIRFRMPISGSSKERNFNFEDKVEKLFIFVDCFCRDEFQQKFNDFDLRQSFPPLNMADYKDKTINEVFEGSRRQNLIVREL